MRDYNLDPKVIKEKLVNELEDVKMDEKIVLDLPDDQKESRKGEIIDAVYGIFDSKNSQIKRYDGENMI